MAICALIALAAAPQVYGQDSARRREELARVIDKVNDPDPLMRIANLEEIIARGDATEVQLAVKTALASNDAELRGIALRGYAANLRDLYLDTRVPKELEAKLSEADPRDREALQIKQALATWQRTTSNRLHVRIDKIDMKSGRFVAYGMNRLDKPNEQMRGEGQIVGGRMRMDVGFWGAKRCTIELSPAPSLNLEGTAVCEDMPRMLVSMPMY
jgi:hypothetical protein